ncbi:MAG: PAS domain S-box protein [Desulfatiglans sp.]|jgi:PAS domain S-box-containing protein|nr:PAS domain S-box protein [Desulfatiglans sp.]
MTRTLLYHELDKRVRELEMEIENHRLAEEALIESEQRYRGVFDSAVDGMLITDLDTIILDANPSYCQMLGYSKEELIGRKVLDHVHPDFHDNVVEFTRQVKETGKTLMENVSIRKDGTFFPIEVHGAAFSHYGQLALLAIIRDISKYKAVLEALRSSEEKYRLLVETANDAIFIAQDGIVKFPNPKAKELVGYSEEEFRRTPFTQIIHPDDRQMVYERHIERLKRRGAPDTYPFRIVNKTGKEIWVQLNVASITWEGEPASLNFVRDISLQRQLESQLRRSQKMEALGTLAGGVAHDLNNILSGLVTYPELLLMNLEKDDPLEKPLQTIKSSGEKAASIVQDLLALARRGVPIKEVVDLNRVVSDYLKSPEHQKLVFYHPGVDVETDLSTDLLRVLGSSVHLSKVFMNLVSNAAEAMPKGGKTFISTTNLYIEREKKGFETIPCGEYVALSVSDTGIGISKEDMERVFEPFYTKKVMGRSGTGLGMAVVWGAVKDNSGYIDIQSAEDKGTTFTLYFPATRKIVKEHEPDLNMNDYRGEGETILIADDIKEQREIASLILKELGYSVSLCSSGEEAIDFVKDHGADLVILDMIMDPGMDGLETYRKLLEICPGQKAVIASGYSETDRVKEALNIGVGAFLKKPYTIKNIGLAVKTEIKR